MVSLVTTLFFVTESWGEKPEFLIQQTQKRIKEVQTASMHANPMLEASLVSLPPMFLSKNRTSLSKCKCSLHQIFRLALWPVALYPSLMGQVVPWLVGCFWVIKCLDQIVQCFQFLGMGLMSKNLVLGASGSKKNMYQLCILHPNKFSRG